MSVSQVKKLSEHKGCSWTIGVLMILALGSSLFTCNRGANPNQPEEAAKEAPLGTIGKTPILYSAVDKKVESMRAQQPFGIPGEALADVMGNALFNTVEEAISVETANRAGVKPTDEQVINQFNSTINMQLETLRMQMQVQKKLKANATDAEFDAAFKKESGKSIEEARKEAIDGLRNALANPAQREQIVAEASLSLYGDKLKDELTFTDAELKVSRDILLVKRIFTKDPAKMEAAQKELKEGKSFEDVMAKYTEDRPDPQKSIKDTTQNLPVAMVLGTKKAALKDAKVSEVLGPFETEEGQAMYLIVKRTVNPIKEFDKLKASLRDEVVGQAVSTIRMEKIGDVRKEGVKWNSKGAEALLNIYKEDFIPGNQAMVDRYQAIIEGPLGAESELERRLNIFTRQIALQRLSKAWTPAERTKNIERTLTISNELFEITESVSARLKLVDDLITAKRPEAVDQLLPAINANSGFEQVNEAQFGNLGATLLKLKNAKLGTPEKIKEAEDLLKKWRTDKLAADKDRAELKRQEEAERKKLAEEERKAAEEAKKKAAGDKKAPAGPPSSKDLTGN